MGSIMDDEVDIMNKGVENTLDNLISNVLRSEQSQAYIRGLFPEIQHLCNYVKNLEKKVHELECMVNTTEYTLHKIHDHDGKLIDVYLTETRRGY